MRQFFISLMGTLAGIWLSVVIALFGSLILIGAAAAMLGSDKTSSGSVESSSILEIDLRGTVEERQSPASQLTELFGDDTHGTVSLDMLTSTLRKAASDKSIEGVVLECGGLTAGLAQCQAIVTALNEFKKSEKWIYAYGDTYTQADYYIASLADSVFINPVGALDIHGLSSTTLFFKGLLDKIGVEAQVVKVGTYKSAVEPFILTDMSPASREQQNVFLNSIWREIASQIGNSRDLVFDQINALADSACYARPVKFYIDNSLVDKALYRHEFDMLLADKTGKDHARKISLSSYATMRNISAGSVRGDKTIAVLYAIGDITDSQGDGIVAEQLVPEIFELAENDKIDGLILRVNSGGGSAFASEQIWEALQQYKEKTGNPYYVSMSDYAASGGYYISCGADRIYAEPTTLTGSIGIFGILPEGQQLLNKHLGITSATVSTNPEGIAPSFFKPMTPSQRKALQANVDRGYELFVKRCAEGRGMSVDSIKAIAEGRVWDGQTALSIGLVDKLGGLETVIEDMKTELEAEKCKILSFPVQELNFKQELRKAMSGFSLRSGVHTDCFDPYYNAVRNFIDMNTVQCRMDFIIVE